MAELWARAPKEKTVAFWLPLVPTMVVEKLVGAEAVEGPLDWRPLWDRIMSGLASRDDLEAFGEDSS